MSSWADMRRDVDVRKGSGARLQLFQKLLLLPNETLTESLNRYLTALPCPQRSQVCVLHCYLPAMPANRTTNVIISLVSIRSRQLGAHAQLCFKENV